MPGGVAGFKASVETCGRIHALVAKYTPHHLVAARIVIEVELCSQVPEQMGMDLETSKLPNRFGDLVA